jgi:acyl-CoA hydrolase
MAFVPLGAWGRYHPAVSTEPEIPGSEVRLLELVEPFHTNHYGTLFGGNALGWMDKAGYLAATRHARHTFVTVATDRIEFKVPVRAGQLVELVARVTREGRTSVTVGVEMYVEDLLIPNSRQLATSGTFVFVAIDEAGNPTALRGP